MEKKLSGTETKGLIFDIQGHSVHDGPGCRTLVFLAGCPLRCRWCSNPEGQMLRRRLMYRTEKCLCRDHRCIDACPKGAGKKSDDEEGQVTFDREICDKCETFECVKSCYRGALEVSGRYYTTNELMKILNRDRFYWGCEGGVTFGGGDPLFQRGFLLSMLKKCRDSYIHTAIETSGSFPPEHLSNLLEYLDWIFMDIKHMNPQTHKQATGAKNDLTLNNIKMIAESDWQGRLVLRNTIIPDFNDSVENTLATAEFMKEAGLSEINVLPFHRLGTSKYKQLGQKYAYAAQPSPPEETMEKIKKTFESKGITCYVGADTPF